MNIEILIGDKSMKDAGCRLLTADPEILACEALNLAFLSAALIVLFSLPLGH